MKNITNDVYSCPQTVYIYTAAARGLDDRTYLKVKERKNYKLIFKSVNNLIVYSKIIEIGSGKIIIQIFALRIASGKYQQGRITHYE